METELINKTLLLDPQGSDAGELTSNFREATYSKVDPGRQSYNGGEMFWDTQSISSSGRWADMSEAILDLPVIMTIKGPAAVDLKAHDLANHVIGLKNASALQLIQSYRVKMNNTQIVDECVDINQYLIFRMHESLSDQEVELKGKQYMYAPDGTDWIYDGVTIVNGNDNNKGFEKRCNFIKNTKTLTDSNESAIYANASDLTESLKNAGESYVDYLNGNNLAVYYITAHLPLKLLMPWNSKNYGLQRGAHFHLTMRFNNCSFTVTNDGGDLTISDYTGGSTNPVMINADNFYGADGDYKVTLAVSRTPLDPSLAGEVANIQHQCQGQIFVPTYEPHPTLNSQLLSLGSKKLTFDAVHQTTGYCNAKANIEHLVISSTSRVKRLLVCTYFNDEDIPSTSNCFNSAPATVDPVYLQNIRIDYGSKPMFPEPLNQTNLHYALEHNGIKGNFMGMSSQLTQDRFDSGLYRFYVFDLTRARAMEDVDVGLTLKFYAKNLTNKKVMFKFFYTSEVSVNFDFSTGALTNST